VTTHPCAAATCHRSLFEHEQVAHQALCTPCIRILGAWLAEIPTQIIVLEGSRQRETTSAGTGGRVAIRTAPLPGRPDVLNLLGPAAWSDVRDPHGDQHGPLPIAGVLIPWVRLICEERRWNPPASLTAQALSGWLAQPRPLDWASRRPWAGAMRDELHELMRTIRSTTRLRPQRRPIAQPCPRCDSLQLVETDHQLYIDCTACGAMFTREELAMAARIATAGLKEGAA
jgi:ribosomal protein S27E